METDVIPDKAMLLPRQYALAIFTIEEIRAELRQLLRALGPEVNEMYETDDEGWREIINSLYLHLGAGHGTGIVKAWARATTCHHRQAMQAQIKRALAAAAHAGKLSGPGYRRTECVLLPTTYAQRIELLLGQGVLPVVWVKRLDLLKF